MNRHKDFFELFKENSHKLSERPTPRTWRRLERRLDSHNRQNRYQNNWTLGMVAAVLGIVACIGLLTFSFNENKSTPVALEDASPRYLEELASVDTEDDLNPIRVIEFQRHYQDKSSPIAEGTILRKLQPADEDFMTD